MQDQYFELLIKKKSGKKAELIKKIAEALMIVTAFTGVVLAIPLCIIVAIILAVIYYFKVLPMDSEFEYFYMDHELMIARIVNKSRRKNLLSLKEGNIVLIAPYDSEKLRGYSGLKLIDCSAGDSDNPPYVMICHHKDAMVKVYIQLNESFIKALKKDMPYKVNI